jgi:hypothetical protein
MLIDDKLYKRRAMDDTKVFYLKMKGDYYKYMAETGEAEEIQKSFEAYSHASDIAESLPVCNLVRLGLALNFSVFYYELKKEPIKAIELAETTFYKAIPTLEELDERAYKEAIQILRLIKDNSLFWGSEIGPFWV